MKFEGLIFSVPLTYVLEIVVEMTSDCNKLLSDFLVWGRRNWAGWSRHQMSFLRCWAWCCVPSLWSLRQQGPHPRTQRLTHGKLQSFPVLREATNPHLFLDAQSLMQATSYNSLLCWTFWLLFYGDNTISSKLWFFWKNILILWEEPRTEKY